MAVFDACKRVLQCDYMAILCASLSAQNIGLVRLEAHSYIILHAITTVQLCRKHRYRTVLLG